MSWLLNDWALGAATLLAGFIVGVLVVLRRAVVTERQDAERKRRADKERRIDDAFYLAKKLEGQMNALFEAQRAVKTHSDTVLAHTEALQKIRARLHALETSP